MNSFTESIGNYKILESLEHEAFDTSNLHMQNGMNICLVFFAFCLLPTFLYLFKLKERVWFQFAQVSIKRW